MDFQSILVPEDNRKQNPDKSYTNKCQKHVACSYGYKLACVDELNLISLLKLCLGEDAVYNFISIVIEESKYLNDLMKKYFNKELVVTKKDKEVFENSNEYWICDYDNVDNDV